MAVFGFAELELLLATELITLELDVALELLLLKLEFLLDVALELVLEVDLMLDAALELVLAVEFMLDATMELVLTAEFVLDSTLGPAFAGGLLMVLVLDFELTPESVRTVKGEETLESLPEESTAVIVYV